MPSLPGRGAGCALTQQLKEPFGPWRAPALWHPGRSRPHSPLPGQLVPIPPCGAGGTDAMVPTGLAQLLTLLGDP